MAETKMNSAFCASWLLSLLVLGVSQGQADLALSCSEADIVCPSSMFTWLTGFCQLSCELAFTKSRCPDAYGFVYAGQLRSGACLIYWGSYYTSSGKYQRGLGEVDSWAYLHTAIYGRNLNRNSYSLRIINGKEVFQVKRGSKEHGSVSLYVAAVFFSDGCKCGVPKDCIVPCSPPTARAFSPIPLISTSSASENGRLQFHGEPGHNYTVLKDDRMIVNMQISAINGPLHETAKHQPDHGTIISAVAVSLQSCKLLVEADATGNMVVTTNGAKLRQHTRTIHSFKEGQMAYMPDAPGLGELVNLQSGPFNLSIVAVQQFNDSALDNESFYQGHLNIGVQLVDVPSTPVTGILGDLLASPRPSASGRNAGTPEATYDMPDLMHIWTVSGKAGVLSSDNTSSPLASASAPAPAPSAHSKAPSTPAPAPATKVPGAAAPAHVTPAEAPHISVLSPALPPAENSDLQPGSWGGALPNCPLADANADAPNSGSARVAAIGSSEILMP